LTRIIQQLVLLLKKEFLGIGKNIFLEAGHAVTCPKNRFPENKKIKKLKIAK
jgi:hypothetical protein